MANATPPPGASRFHITYIVRNDCGPQKRPEGLDLARGPGRLTQAMQIDFRQQGLDLCAAGPLWLATSQRKTGAIGKSVRIGLTRNVDRKLRFYERGNPYVSGPKRLRE